jgi:N-acetylmuramoyl-L-alanine amidase
MEINNSKHNTKILFKTGLFIKLLLLIALSVSASEYKYEKKWVIVIDPGHGGIDPGALGSISREKDITLAIALKTGEYIEKNLKNVTVVYTRKDDSTVDLSERPKIANKAKADLFISIHANWANSKTIKGAETFIMGLAKDQQNLEVAMKENEVIYLEKDYSTKYEGFDPKSPESYVMFSLMQNIFQKQSTGLASNIQSQYKNSLNRTDRGVKQAGFWVLFMTTMPGVLTETGFITNPAEEKYLVSREGQDNIAASIFRACKTYINDIESKSGISTAENQVSENEVNIPDISTSGEIEFMVQIATSKSKTEIRPENFKGLKEISEIISPDRYRYVSGKFADYTSAVEHRKKIEGIYPDAFVIAVRDNKIVPLQEALEQKR